MEIIRSKGLNKTYRRFEKEAGLMGSAKSLFRRKMVEKAAVQDFDLGVSDGEFVGLIGPNGAGKTTLVKMLTGIVAPTSGELSVLGYWPNKLADAFKRQYALVMGQKSQLFFELTAADSFLLFKEMYDIPAEKYRDGLGYFVELFGVRDQLNVQVRTLSLGERMKMELIAALLHNPKLLFLDEPTIGLDAVAQKQIRSFLAEVNRDRGTTILLTSHYMEDIRSLCKRCVVINGGKKLYDGDTHGLFDKYQVHRKLTVTFAAETEYRPNCPVGMLEKTPYHMAFLAKKADVQPILRDMLLRCEITDIAIDEEDIGQVVERIYGEAGAR